MSCIKIKQMDERVATMGLHMGGPATRRKLEPGEAVFVPDDLEQEGENLFDALWDTGKVELVPGNPTRPFEYENVAEAKMCSPSFKPHDNSETAQMHKTREAVAKRVIAEFGEEKPKKSGKKAKPATKADSQAASRRSLRRQMLDGDNGDGANTSTG